MNSITNLLDLEDSEIIVDDIQIQNQTKTIVLSTVPTAHFCPSCGFKMHSRGIKTRTINHPIFQDGYRELWKKHNPALGYNLFFELLTSSESPSLKGYYSDDSDKGFRLEFLKKEENGEVYLENPLKHLIYSGVYDKTHFKEMWGNILLFIPFGAGIKLLIKSKHPIAVTIFAGFLFSFSIEILQLFTRCGYFELFDLVLNCAGVAAGGFISELICERI